MKAMIFAAGRGERMRPFTDTTPKPLVKVGGETLIERHIRKIASIGIKEIIINVSYLGSQIMDKLGDGSAYGVRINYSVEKEPLEVAGGIIQALPLLGDAPFLAMSADIFTDYPLENLILAPDHWGHLVFVKNPSWHAQGDYAIHDGYLVDSTDGLTSLTYANFGILSPTLFQGFEPGKRRVREVFARGIEQQKMTAEVFSGLWLNIGTMALLEEAREVVRGLNV